MQSENDLFLLCNVWGLKWGSLNIWGMAGMAQLRPHVWSLCLTLSWAPWFSSTWPLHMASLSHIRVPRGRTAKKMRPWRASTYYSSAYVMLAKNPLAKATHMVKPRHNVEGHMQGIWTSALSFLTLTSNLISPSPNFLLHKMNIMPSSHILRD